MKIRNKITGGQGWAAFSRDTQLNITTSVSDLRRASVLGTTIWSRNKGLRSARSGFSSKLLKEKVKIEKYPPIEGMLDLHLTRRVSK